ncbi:GNAT family acetyltransferase [Loktanella sp. 3ANDIMAR09]|uniref:GNAT family N-acetyltransferase n=1 Tax=Loktanella sp. 3ANDIMAR09 TaxID=1225657 RepID=UPI0006F8155F|nr:GNAT family N-acetyltransferase [Loktanella sp. 3ANDIMAR09]KQI67835.1 GNAT family acetyltransferase [Loktanella sp. 3ANDIMAR09]
MIRAATRADAAAICAIWNPIIRETGITFTAIEKTPQAIVDLIATRPVLVAETGGVVAGFATYGPFRGGDGYRHTAEHTVHLAPAARGAGLGRLLMDALCADARGAGIHTLWAGCSAENPAGVAFHEKLGFVKIATLPQVGRKFDRWIDLILLTKML